MYRICHKRNRETPLPIYIALKVHTDIETWTHKLPKIIRAGVFHMIESCLFQLMLPIPCVQDFSLTVYYVPHKHSVVSSPLLLWSTLTIIPAPHQLMASSMTQPSHYYSTQHMHVQVYRDHLQWSVRIYKAGVLSSPLPVEYNVVNPIVLPTLTQWCLQQNILCSLHCSLSVNRMEALGTTGLMTLRRWMVAGPEISRMIQELSAIPSTL